MERDTELPMPCCSRETGTVREPARLQLCLLPNCANGDPRGSSGQRGQESGLKSTQRNQADTKHTKPEANVCPRRLAQ